VLSGTRRRLVGAWQALRGRPGSEASAPANGDQARHRFVVQAHACLGSSLEYESNLRQVSRLAVPVFADASLVHLRGPEGGLTLLCADHVDPGLGPLLEDLGRRHLEPAGLAEGFWRAFASREPELLVAAGEGWGGRARGADEAALLQRLGLGSSLALPLLARDRALGTLTMLTVGGGRAFGPRDLELGRDLADRAATAVDNALLYEEARRLNRVKDEFLALLSHELRTPLGSALVWLELLRSERLEPSALRAVDMVHRSARQLAGLIDQLLDMSRTIAGKLSVAIEASEATARAKGVRLESRIDRTLERSWGDPNRLRQAVGNLVSNAVKFTPAGGEITVSLERVGGLARIEVRDTGAGIAPELLPALFERFRLGDTRSTRAQGGLGLGLAIARYIAEQHEGNIRAASEGPGRGSVFTFDLPLKAPPGPGEPAVVRAGEGPLEGLRVLLVEDHLDTLHGLALGLGSGGAQVTPVSSVREALAALPQVRPDVVVSDLAMPDQDGFTLIDEIRKLPPEAGGLVPAVAVSASVGPSDRQRALDAGYHEHVAKPVEIGRLVETVGRLARSAAKDRAPTL
jgi:signal transduction histidine kinase/CheY-like chemotaxis protein